MNGPRYLTVEEVERLHALVVERTGGATGLRDRGALESAVAQPQQTFGGEELYPSLAAQTAALAYSLVMGHPFVDGNKRMGHAAMETFLMLNGYEIEASVDEQETLFLSWQRARSSGRRWQRGSESTCSEVVDRSPGTFRPLNFA